ncbi:MAG: hypothetical protein O9253_00485 [Aquidulcibacter sp.]|nr:hypothetical protein [Aquidulcibacter sp.]
MPDVGTFGGALGIDLGVRAYDGLPRFVDPVGGARGWALHWKMSVMTMSPPQQGQISQGFLGAVSSWGGSSGFCAES